MAEALTPEQVWEVDLPVLNIVARVRQIREYAEDMRLAHTTIGVFGFTGENPITRRGLAIRAERHVQDALSWRVLEDIIEGARLREMGSVVVDARHRFGVN